MTQFMGNNVFRDAQTGAGIVPEGPTAQRLAQLLLGVAPSGTVPQGFQFPGSQLAQELARRSMILNGGGGPNRVPNSMLNNLPPPPAPAPAPRRVSEGRTSRWPMSYYIGAK